MKKVVFNLSFRSKILIVLLFITVLFSIFSLIFLHSINQINQVSNKIKDNNIPEIIWISHWEEELNIKEYVVNSYIKQNVTDQFIATYEAQEMDDRRKEKQIPVPESLKSLKGKMDLLDFQIINNVQGLIQYGDEEAARQYIKKHYIPELKVLKRELQKLESDTFLSLNGHSESFPKIIKETLLLLCLLTAGAVILSIYASYRISANLTKPVEQMINKVDDIANGQYGLTVNETNQIELQHLSQSINQMSHRLKESFHIILNDKIYREQILNSLPVGVITIDDKTSVVSLNASAQAFLHMDSDQVQVVMEEGNSSQNTMFWDILSSKQICQNVKVSFSMNKTSYHLLISQAELFNQQQQVIGRIFYFIDITKKTELENRIHQSEKLALVGELAAGAAHEIRNPLAVIQGFLSLMNSSISEEQRKQFYLPLIMKELDRINSIIEEMLLLSKPGAPILQEMFIEDIIEEILPLIRPAKENDVQFIVDLERVPLSLDTKQIKQVFHNLIRNSIEAMNGKGTVTIRSAVQNDCYHIYIEDTGNGIPEEIQQTIYDPFLTSKETGTGLGLTIVQRILQNHKGKIELVSTSSAGTTFLISLPLTSDVKSGMREKIAVESL